MRHGRHGHGCGRGRSGWEGKAWRRARRGDVKFFILEILAEGPRHGYDIIAALEEKSGGRYRPSPGSVYPTLQLLEDGGFVTAEAVDGKRVFTITDSGRALLKNKPPETKVEVGEQADVWEAFTKLATAIRQAAMVSDPPVQEKLRAILNKARREVYTLLAEDD
jgi:DNA-binding PadR family transcriptional regulator